MDYISCCTITFGEQFGSVPVPLQLKAPPKAPLKKKGLEKGRRPAERRAPAKLPLPPLARGLQLQFLAPTTLRLIPHPGNPRNMLNNNSLGSLLRKIGLPTDGQKVPAGTPATGPMTCPIGSQMLGNQIKGSAEAQAFSYSRVGGYALPSSNFFTCQRLSPHGEQSRASNNLFAPSGELTT